MPWHQEPMKDVISCDKLRGAANEHWSGDFRMGKPTVRYRIPIWFSIRYLAVGFPIRKSPDRSLFAAPRSLSQLITSFIGSWCQGIPLALLLAWPIKLSLYKLTIRKVHSMVLYSWIMQAHIRWSLFRQNCILPNLIKNKFPFMLPSHNCIIITMFSFQGASESL